MKHQTSLKSEFIEVIAQPENARMSIIVHSQRRVFLQPAEVDNLIRELVEVRNQCWPWPKLEVNG